MAPHEPEHRALYRKVPQTLATYSTDELGRVAGWWYGVDFSDWAVPHDHHTAVSTLLIYGYLDRDARRENGRTHLRLTTERRPPEEPYDLVLWWVIDHIGQDWVAYLCGVRTVCELLLRALPKSCSVHDVITPRLPWAAGSGPTADPRKQTWRHYLPPLYRPPPCEAPNDGQTHRPP